MVILTEITTEQSGIHTLSVGGHYSICVRDSEGAKKEYRPWRQQKWENLLKFECTFFTDALFVILYTLLTLMFIYWSRKSIIAKLQIIGLIISHSTARQID
jgi:hypothetical protein